MMRWRARAGTHARATGHWYRIVQLIVNGLFIVNAPLEQLTTLIIGP